jgi:hypothetical protein
MQEQQSNLDVGDCSEAELIVNNSKLTFARGYVFLKGVDGLVADIIEFYCQVSSYGTTNRDYVVRILE